MPGAQAPFAQPAVWPPPPMIAGQTQPGWMGPACGFKTLFRRAPGKPVPKCLPSDYRAGHLQCDSEGIVVEGKAVPRPEVRLMVTLPLIFLSMPLGIIALLVMEYAMRRERREGIRWDSIRRLTLAPEKGQAAIVYDGYNQAAQVKTYSLAFTLEPGRYETFAEAARRNAPDRVEEAALVSSVAPVLWVCLAVALLAGLGLVMLALHK